MMLMMIFLKIFVHHRKIFFCRLPAPARETICVPLVPCQLGNCLGGVIIIMILVVKIMSTMIKLSLTEGWIHDTSWTRFLNYNDEADDDYDNDNDDDDDEEITPSGLFST